MEGLILAVFFTFYMVPAFALAVLLILTSVKVVKAVVEQAVNQVKR